MKIAVLGTGMVGRAFAARLVDLGHDVVVGMNVHATLARTEPDGMGNPPYAVWQQEHPQEFEQLRSPTPARTARWS